MSAGRVPPHDLDAEAAVLSAILLNREALDVVQVILKQEHFYSDANGKIFDAAGKLAEQNEPIDIIQVASWLRDREQIAQIGGAGYLAQLADATPAVAHVGAHAAQVYEKWRLRQLIATCQKVAAEGYGDVGIVQEFIDGAEQSIYQIARTGKKEATIQVAAIVAPVFKAITDAAERGDRMTGISTGYEKLDAKTAGLHDGELTIVAARPGMGKTALAMNMAVNVASDRTLADDTVRIGDGVVVFSLEMPKESLVQRLICSEGRVDIGKLRQGYLQPDDWRKLTESSAYIASLPIWINDVPSTSLLDIRAEVRRVQAKFNRVHEDPRKSTRVGLVVIDYLQLMKGRDGVNSREQEISEISRGLKALAKELSVPVIALAQLNREVEKRGKDKRPQLSDLRECLTGDSIVPDPVTGELIPLRDHPRRAYGLTATWRSATTDVVEVWSTGVKPIWKVTTASGRTLRCTINHPLRPIYTWTPIGEILPGTRVAVPRSVPEPTEPTNPMTDDELRLAALLVSDGHYGKHRSVGYVKADPALVNEVRRIAAERFGIEAKDHACPGEAEQIELTVTDCGPNGNPLINWLRDIGIHGQLGHEKRFPSATWRCDNRKLAIFLGYLWAGDGSVVPRNTGGTVLKFPSTSMALLDDVCWALTRLGIVFSRGPSERNSKSTMDIATVSVGESEALLRFASLVTIPGVKGERLTAAVAEAAAMGRNARLDRLPIEVTTHVRAQKVTRGLSWRQLGYRCQGKEMCRADLARVAEVLDDAELTALATSDVLWDEVVSVTADGEEETFDLRAPTTANVVASGFFAHNSGAIEQDADTIIFIYRDEYYFPETTEMKGLAELIIAKQRNGAPGKAMVRFTGSCTRFDNLAMGDYPEMSDE